MTNRIQLILGDSFEKLKTIPKNSLAAVVSDPPYGISFMGKSWDRVSLAEKHLEELEELELEVLEEEDEQLTLTELHSFQGWAVGWLRLCFLALKPGGVIKVFGATRTFHRMAAAMQQAGFEIVGLEAWVQGQGFPKSLNISKAIDKMQGVNPDLERQISLYLKTAREKKGLSKSEVDQLVFNGSTRYGWVEGRSLGETSKLYLPTPEEWLRLKEVLDLDDTYDAYIQEAIPTRENRFKADGGKAQEIGRKDGDWGFQKNGERWAGEQVLTQPKSEQAQQWEGWGTALKPSWEPFLVGRKPLT